MLQQLRECVDLVRGNRRPRQLSANACALEYCTHGISATHGTSGCRTGITTPAPLHPTQLREWCNLDAEEHRKKFFFASRHPWRLLQNFLSLTVANADQAVTVTNDDRCGEAEATTTLDDLGNAVDGHNALDVLVLLTLSAQLLRRSWPTLAAVVAALLTLGWRSRGFIYLRSPSSFTTFCSLIEVQDPPRACTVSNGCCPAVVLDHHRGRLTASTPAALARSATGRSALCLSDSRLSGQLHAALKLPGITSLTSSIT